MRRLLLYLSCFGMIFWSNPTTYLPDGTPISEHDRQEITTHLYVGHSPIGPWSNFADVLYGEEMWVGIVEPEHYFTGYCELYGMESAWAVPMFSGPAPIPEPPPDPIPEPPKRGKGWGKGGKH